MTRPIPNGMIEAGYKSELKCDAQRAKLPSEIFPRIISALFIVVVIVACWISASHPIVGSLLCGASLLVVFALTRWQSSLEWLYDLGKPYTSENVIATNRSCPDPAFDLVFVAHYDSKSQALPIAARALCYCVAVAGFIGLTLLIILDATLDGQLPPSLIWMVGSCIVLCLILLQINFTQNHSPGAFDNASSVGVLLELARCMKISDN